MTDRRPEPKPKKHPELWQSYLWWDEMMETKKRHDLRISSAERDKSNLSAQFERHMLELTHTKDLLKETRKMMISYGEQVGPVWDWLTSIKGLGAGGEAAKLLAQIDDIGKFATVSKLWAYAGWAVRDGEIQRLRKGQKAPYNRDIKAVCWRIVDQFVRQRTDLYRDLYDQYKVEEREKHPNAICKKCGTAFDVNGKKPKCPECGQTNAQYGLLYTDAHIDARAKRRVAKIFLQHLWVVWRESEGLPVTDPWIIAHGGHVDYIPPPNWENRTAV